MASFECTSCGSINVLRSGIHCCGDAEPESCGSCGSHSVLRIGCCGSR